MLYKVPAPTVFALKPVAHWNLFSKDSILLLVLGSSIVSLSPTLDLEPVDPYGEFIRELRL
ncbi:MAG: hypothetical protein QG552_255 [Thermodesulfobacteriota bacterium]|nr:hypothetical protein [Thermodesulfobacteriota bacterium]